MDDIIGLAVRFIVFIFAFTLYYGVVCAWPWGKTGYVYGLSVLVEPMLFTPETRCATDVIYFD